MHGSARALQDFCSFLARSGVDFCYRTKGHRKGPRAARVGKYLSRAPLCLDGSPQRPQDLHGRTTRKESWPSGSQKAFLPVGCSHRKSPPRPGRSHLEVVMPYPCDYCDAERREAKSVCPGCGYDYADLFDAEGNYLG